MVAGENGTTFLQNLQAHAYQPEVEWNAHVVNSESSRNLYMLAFYHVYTLIFKVTSRLSNYLVLIVSLGTNITSDRLYQVMKYPISWVHQIQSVLNSHAISSQRVHGQYQQLINLS